MEVDHLGGGACRKIGLDLLIIAALILFDRGFDFGVGISDILGDILIHILSVVSPQVPRRISVTSLLGALPELGAAPGAPGETQAAIASPAIPRPDMRKKSLRLIVDLLIIISLVDMNHRSRFEFAELELTDHQTLGIASLCRLLFMYQTLLQMK